MSSKDLDVIRRQLVNNIYKLSQDDKIQILNIIAIRNPHLIVDYSKGVQININDITDQLLIEISNIVSGKIKNNT